MLGSNTIFLPPGAVMSTSVAFIWDKKENVSDGYRIYINGQYDGETVRADYTAKGLLPYTEYTLEVRAVCGNDEMSIGKVKTVTMPESRVYNIVDFGAVSDGITVNTAAIQRAVEECCENGTVYIPSGIFVTGSISLKSNMTLFVEKDAVLIGSDNPDDYPIMNYRFEGIEDVCYASLIDAYHTENLNIVGEGVINANGAALKKAELAENKGKRGRAVCIRNSKNIYLQDITIRQSPAWCLHTIYSENITLNNVNIHTKYDENGNIYDHIINGDGFDPDSCSNVYVFNSMIASQDDCIAIKSGKNEEGRSIGIPCENIRITDCVFKSGFGVVVGSEMSGDVRNVFVRDCIFENTHSIASIKPPRGRGGVVENIHYENCTLKNLNAETKDCEWFRGAINIDMFYSHCEVDTESAEEINDGTPLINGVYFKNIELYTNAGNAVYMAGLPESHIKNVFMENVHTQGKRGMTAINVDGLKLDNFSVKADEGETRIVKNTVIL